MPRDLFARRREPPLGAVAGSAPEWRIVLAHIAKDLLRGMSAITLGFASCVGTNAASLQWDANGAAPGSGGSGTWNTTTALWFNGSSFQNWNNATLDDAVFGGTAGTVTLGVPITAHNLTFNTSGYVLTNSALTLGGINPTVSVVSGGTAIINLGIAGTAGLNSAGPGTLILSNTNSYTGGTTIGAGTLQIGNGGGFGSVVGNIVDNAALVINRSGTLILGSTITGTGSLTQVGTGITVLTGDSTYTGGTTISAGTLQLGNAGTTGSISGDIVDNAALKILRSNTVTLSGVISGTGSLTQAGTGTTILTGDSTYTGGTTITAGTLQIGNGGTTGSITGNIVDNAALVFNRSDALTYAGVISGTGSLTQAGIGTTILTGANTYTGGTTISAGTLQIGNGGTTGSITGNIVDNAALVFNRSNALTYAGVVSGTGSLTKSGAGTLTLTGDSTYTGGTTISAGTLQIGNGGTTGSITGNIVDNAALVFNRSNALTYAGVISGTGSLTKSGAGTLTLTGDSTYTGGTTISAGTLQIGNGGTTGSITGNIVDNAALVFNRSDALTYAGVISGTGSLTQAGTGTTILTGANTYTGGTTISAGTLQIGNGGTTGSVTGNIVDNAALVFNRSDALTYAGVISGTGSLTQAGIGTTILTGANTYTGGTTICCRDAADRQWRHHRQHHRQHRRQRRAGVQPQQCADLCRRSQRHRLVRPRAAPAR